MSCIHQMAAEKSDRLFKASRELHNNKNNQYEHSKATLETKKETLNCVVFFFFFLSKVKCRFDRIPPNRRNKRFLPSTLGRSCHSSP